MPQSTDTEFKLILFNLSDVPVTASMTGWNVDPGRWELMQGIDNNGDDSMAYVNKQKRRAIETLTLRMKVNAKDHGRSVYGSPEWHVTWDLAEYSQWGILAMLGDDVKRQQLQTVALSNDSAAEVLRTISYCGVTL